MPRTFDFLGFTHYCSEAQNGRFRVKRKTSCKKFRASVKKLREWVRQHMHTPIKELIKLLNRKLEGYYRYYGISDNSYSIWKFNDCVQRILYRILNRRSQKKSMNWQELYQMKKTYNMVKPKVHVNLFERKPKENEQLRIMI
ncbi:MAG: group II intron maturase-specific domain-containing protein [Cellulosilyticaceae bacterium]